jgi:hypothetical protein
MALIVTPWMVRSSRVGHGPLPTRIGENLFVSTSSYAIGVVPEYDVDLLVRFAAQTVDDQLRVRNLPHSEWLADRILTRQALAYAAANPWRALRLKLRNLAWIGCPLLLPRYAKSPLTHAAVIDGSVQVTGLHYRPWWWETLHATFRGVLLVAALIGLISRPGSGHALLLIVLVSETLVYTLFFPTTRLLGVWAAVLMVYAGIGAARVWVMFAGKVKTGEQRGKRSEELLKENPRKLL